MNQHDMDNVQFLLNADDTTMKQWYTSVSQDDVEYALEILAAYRAELALREVELMDEEIDECMMVEAESVLAHVMSLR